MATGLTQQPRSWAGVLAQGVPRNGGLTWPLEQSTAQMEQAPQSWEDVGTNHLLWVGGVQEGCYLGATLYPVSDKLVGGVGKTWFYLITIG